MQLLAGCWLIVDEHLNLVQLPQIVEESAQTNDTPTFAEADPSEPEQKQTEITPVSIAMVKKCMQKITLKDAVNKVTALVGKNLTQTKSFLEIVGEFSEEHSS